MLGYTYEDVIHMLDSINIAYEIVDVPSHVDEGLKKAASLLIGLVSEGHIQWLDVIGVWRFIVTMIFLNVLNVKQMPILWS